MLCHNCEKSLKATTKRLNLVRQCSLLGKAEECLSLPTSLLHLSQRSLYRSIVDGCFICRQLWMSLQQDEGIEEGRIPQTFEDFCRITRDLEHLDLGGPGLKPFSFGHNLITRGAKRTVGSILFYSLSLFPGYKKYTKNSLIVRVTEKVSSWCNQRALMYLRAGEHEDLFFTIVPGRSQRLDTDFYLFPVYQRVSDITYPPSVNIDGAHTSTGGMTRLWRNWFRTCSETHTRCREVELRLQSFIPKRLIQLLPNNCGNISNWRLVLPTTFDKPYLTLSHCWGSSQPIRLTKDNFSEFLQGSSVFSLPKTYQHAIIIANSLEFQYIWIDSLCIVQDDIEDWRAQSILMGSIYGNAACNIAATWATDSGDGCFSTGDPDIAKPCFITLDQKLNESSTYQISIADRYSNDIVEAPLNRRGWVLQERVLARKQLSFSKHQVYWECHELMASEQFPSGVPARLGNLNDLNQAHLLTAKPRLDFEDKMDIRRAWSALVDLYSACELTHESDKLPAVSGLITELGKVTNDACIAGLWNKDFYQQLCWTNNFYTRHMVNRTTTKGRLAPTWSWVNLSGPVLFDQSYEGIISDATSWIEIIEIPKDSAEQNESSNPVRQKLVLKGVAVWGRAMANGDLAENTICYHDHQVVIDFISAPGLPASSSIDVSIFWDENMSSAEVNPDRWPAFVEERKANLLFLIIYHGDFSTKGLVLRRQSSIVDGDVLYVRMGCFWAYDSEFEPFLNQIATRLQVPQQHVINCLDLNNSKLADLVHIVTIV